MIRINLLAVERAQRSKPARASFQFAQKVTVACSLVLVLTALGIAWWYWTLQKDMTAVDEEISSAQEETRRLNAIIQQVQGFERRKAQLEERVNLVEQLRAHQSGPVRMLDEISRGLPDMLWLIELRQQGSEVTLSGRCTSLTSITDFVSNIEGSGFFKKPVEILETRVEPSGQGQAAVEVIRFTLKAFFSPPGRS
jgi:type IV pilus assembly protein PilN